MQQTYEVSTIVVSNVPNTQKDVRNLSQPKSISVLEGIIALQIEVTWLYKMAHANVSKEHAKSLLDQLMTQIRNKRCPDP